MFYAVSLNWLVGFQWLHLPEFSLIHLIHTVTDPTSWSNFSFCMQHSWRGKNGLCFTGFESTSLATRLLRRLLF